MKRNFYVYRDSMNAHLKLFGDFDELSACELSEVVTLLEEDAYKIFVHTDTLHQILPEGVRVFERKTGPATNKLVFTGKHAGTFQPKRGRETC